MPVTGQSLLPRTITIEPAPPAVFATAPNITITYAAAGAAPAHRLLSPNGETGVLRDIRGSVTGTITGSILPAVVHTLRPGHLPMLVTERSLLQEQ